MPEAEVLDKRVWLYILKNPDTSPPTTFQKIVTMHTLTNDTGEYPFLKTLLSDYYNFKNQYLACKNEVSLLF